MSNQSITHEKELLFFDLIRGENVLDYPKAMTEEDFYKGLQSHNRDRRAAAQELTKEIDTNLPLFLNHDSRVSYLAGLVNKIQVELEVVGEMLLGWMLSRGRDGELEIRAYEDNNVKSKVWYQVNPIKVDHHIEDGGRLLSLLIELIASRYKAESYGNSFVEMEMRQFFSKHGITELRSTEEVPERKPLSTLEAPIRHEFVMLLSRIEDKMKTKISNWRAGDDKIECAAFCELLYDKNWFFDKKKRIQKLNSFAMCRYGVDIKNQLAGSKKKDRTKHKSLLARFFV